MKFPSISECSNIFHKPAVQAVGKYTKKVAEGAFFGFLFSEILVKTGFKPPPAFSVAANQAILAATKPFVHLGD